jgi:lipoate-protein ligase A
VLHKNDLSYSITLYASALPLKVEQSYSAITNSLCYAFRKLGLDAKVFTSVNDISAESAMCGTDRMYGDILIRGKKVAGSAQARHKKRVLHHGFINIDFDNFNPAFFLSAINAYKSESNVVGRTTSLTKELGGRVQLDTLKSLIIEGFVTSLGMDWKTALFSETELIEIEQLYVPKYTSREWTDRI